MPGCEEDGVLLDSGTVSAFPIREDDQYGGVRVTMTAKIGSVRVPVQFDVGIGDVITPQAKACDFPVMLDHSVPRLKVYSRETVVAEKFQTIVQRGFANSRMKDYYDLWRLSADENVDPETAPTFFAPHKMGIAPETYYAVFAKGNIGEEETVVNFTGNTKSDLTALDYVAADGLGSDYATSNAPYQVKLDNTGDYILLSLPGVPTSIEIAVKMLGGATASSIAIQECATSDGIFTTVETMSISGSANAVVAYTSSKTYSQKFIKLLF